MKKFSEIIFLIVVFVSGFMWKDEIQNIWMRSLNYYFPCKFPISYSLNQFDNRFNIDRKDFLKLLTEAEAIWEKEIGRNLFEYKDGGLLEVNLIYDERQKTTSQLKSIGSSVDKNRQRYDFLKSEYDLLLRDYYSQKQIYENKVSQYELRRIAYENEVTSINKRGGGNKETVARLNTEKNNLISLSAELNSLQIQLNNKVKEINSSVLELNSLAKILNLNVQKFNEIGSTLGEEFEEGVYISDKDGQRINIYQFDNRTKLVRVLAHEFGHALGINHNEDPKAIMYRLNNGINEKLTQTDLSQLKQICGIGSK